MRASKTRLRSLRLAIKGTSAIWSVFSKNRVKLFQKCSKPTVELWSKRPLRGNKEMLTSGNSSINKLRRTALL
jgi:hypothetical protein